MSDAQRTANTCLTINKFSESFLLLLFWFLGSPIEIYTQNSKTSCDSVYCLSFPLSSGNEPDAHVSACSCVFCTALVHLFHWCCQRCYFTFLWLSPSPSFFFLAPALSLIQYLKRVVSFLSICSGMENVFPVENWLAWHCDFASQQRKKQQSAYMPCTHTRTPTHIACHEIPRLPCEDEYDILIYGIDPSVYQEVVHFHQWEFSTDSPLNSTCAIYYSYYRI